MVTENSTKPVSNGDFLRAIAGALSERERLHIAGFLGSPTTDARWSGVQWRSDDGDCPTRPEDNNYCSVAVLNAAERKRKNFVRMHSLVADDPQTVPEGATWVLQTSAGKCQVGWALVDDAQSRDAELCSRALKAMAQRGMFSADPNGNNIVRYVRLPVGTNTKYSPVFPHVLSEWHPERRFTLGEALRACGIDIDDLGEAEPEVTTTAVEGVPDAEIISTLMRIDPCCDYETWTKAAMGVHHATKGAYRGLKAFDYWSSTAGPEHYPGPKALRIKWDSMGEYDGKPVTWASVERLARDAALEDMTFDIPADDTPEPQAFQGWAELDYSLDTLPPTDYLITGFWAHSMAILAGQPGAGKTTALVALSLVMAGYTIPGCDLSAPAPRKILYVCEDTRQVQDLLYVYAKRFNISDINARFILIESHRADIDHFKKLSHNVRRHTLNGERPVLVADTAAATFELESENDNSEVSRYMGALKATFFVKGNVPVIVATHTAKSTDKADAATTARGASSWTGDATLTAALVDTPQGRFLVLGKRRYTPDFSEILIEPIHHVEQVMTRHGVEQTKTVLAGIPRRSSADERKGQTEEQLQAKEQAAIVAKLDAIRYYLRSCTGEGACYMVDGSGKASTPPGGRIITWAEIWEEVGRVQDQKPIRAAVREWFEPFPDRVYPLAWREEGELW